MRESSSSCVAGLPTAVHLDVLNPVVPRADIARHPRALELHFPPRLRQVVVELAAVVFGESLRILQKT